MRRTKNEMENAYSLCKLYLETNNNDPHKAYDEYIKFYLLSDERMPYYIKGLSDFIKFSKKYKNEYDYNKKLEEKKKEDKCKVNDAKDSICKLSMNDYNKIKKSI